MMPASAALLGLLPLCESALPGWFPNTLSLNVEGSASDEYLSSDQYGVGLSNVVSLDISVQGVSGTIVSADEDVEYDVDTLEWFKMVVGENSVPKWLVLKPPTDFALRSISVVEPLQCAGTPVVDGGRNASFDKAGKRYVLQLPELSKLECGVLKIHVVTRNPAELHYAYESRWKVYLVSNKARLSDFNDSAKSWKDSLIAEGYWRGIFPLQPKVCGLLSSEWTMNSSLLCPGEGAVTTNETELLATLIRDHCFSASVNVSAVVVACPGPAVKVSMAPLDQGSESERASEILSRTMLLFEPPAWSGADQLKSVGKPAWSCDMLSDKSLMSNHQSNFFWVVGLFACLAPLVALCGACCVACDEGDPIRGFRTYILILLLLFSCIPAFIGAVFGVAILAVLMSLIKLCELWINFMPMGVEETGTLCKVVVKFVELVGVAPLKSGMFLLRFLYDFIILKAAMLVLSPMFGFPDIKWFRDFSWPSFFFTLPSWSFIRWSPFSWTTPIFACVAQFLSNAFEYVRGLSFHVGRFGAPCRETLLLSSTPFIFMAVFVLYFFATQDLFLRLVPATITAKQKRNLRSLFAPIIVAGFFSLILAFSQLLANTCADMLAVGLPTAWVDLPAVGTVLPADFCGHPIKGPVVFAAQFCWLISVVAFVALSILILSGSAYQMVTEDETDDEEDGEHAQLHRGQSGISRHEISEQTRNNAKLYGKKLISGICAADFCDKAWSLEYLQAEADEAMKGPLTWFCTQLAELMQITFGIWAEDAAEEGEGEGGVCEEIGEKLLHSVKSYNMEGRKDWCTIRVTNYLKKSGWKPRSEKFKKHTQSAMESHADETILLITARQISLILQCASITTFQAKILEYTNQVSLCDCAHSLKIHEQFTKCSLPASLIMFPLWLSSIGRLVCLFIMIWGPYFGETFESLQYVFAIASTLCFFSGYYDVVSSWFKDFEFTSDLGDSDSASE